VLEFDGPEMRRRRVAAGIRPEEMAVAIRCSVESVHLYERGKVTPRLNRINDIAAAIPDCQATDLLILTDAEVPA
jgi:predicted transcriptional regulator